MKKYKYSLLWGMIMFAGCTLKISDGLPKEELIPYQDKAIHFCIFAILGFIATSEKRKKDCKTLIACTLFGTIIEIIQSFLPWRSFEILDIVSDSLGAGAGIIAAGLLLAWLRRKRTTLQASSQSCADGVRPRTRY